MKNQNIVIGSNNAGLIEIDASRKTALAECEQAIQSGFATFVEVGMALCRIREEQLYRVTHRNFQEYCRQRWSFGKTHANRLVLAAQISHELAPLGAISHETQIRPLLKLKREQRREVWIEAVKLNPQPTQRQVKAAAQGVVGEIKVVRTPKTSGNGTVAIPTFNFDERCRAFLDLGIEEARALADFAECDLREAFCRVKADLESCQRILDEGARQHG